VFGAIGVVDLAFLSANAFKFLDGGFIPLTLGLALFGVMFTWRWGRKRTFAAYSSYKTMTIGELVELHRAQTHYMERNVILMVPKPLRDASDNTPALMQFFWNRYGLLPRNLIFVEVVHRKTPYMRGDRYDVTVLDRDPKRGSILSVAIKFGFLEDPNIERVLEDLARHHLIDLPPDSHLWAVHVSQENLLLSKKVSLRRRIMYRLFHMLRHISQPAYYSYGLGDEVQLSVEIMPVKLG